ncbi:U7 snRNA-associated Sm-like protein LSm11 [Uranotaenia lowii]|uniref:U7 snRNA-associated Sm-like protein LSm11 n=1 Tax=Uranotaenia lowii TaxID=190385 RepID=UPI002478B6FF|nr:U7 snRNA-associated Sm-like protein LSm11 [Uranotaenia lowii]
MSEGESSSRKSDSSEGSSSELDFAGSGFKPLRVLYSRKAQAPVSAARLLDNVGAYESQYKQLGGFDQQFSEERLREIRAANAAKKQIAAPSGQAPVRRFEPHQEMIRVERPFRARRNIFLRIDSYEGPLGELRQWMRERVRVKVYTRREKGVRGFVTGFVEVFDKHWNMALVDCQESWKRRKNRYSENKVCALGEPQDCGQMLRKMGISIPEVTVKSVDRKYVNCSRQVPKLLIRGEQVVLVTPDKESPKVEPP